MARKRMIDPKIWESEQVMSLCSDAFKLYIYLINHADDEGRMVVSYNMIKSRCFPVKNNIPVKKVEEHILHMAEISLILLYTDDTTIYLQHPNWNIYQTINHPTSSKLPPFTEDYRSITVGVPPKLIKDNISKVNIREERGSEVDEVFEYFRTKTGSQVLSTTKPLREKIHARLAEGYTVDQCKRAIAFVYADKKDNPEQKKYIRIETIFAPTKFPGYLDAQLRYSEGEK